MNDLTTVEQANLSLLDTLAVEARAYAENMVTNMLHLGRVLSQAKALIPHGQFEAWVANNVGLNPDYANKYRACYEKYGDKPEYAKLGKSKLIKMLSLPAGTQDEFIAEHDVEGMSVRELDEAVKECLQ